MGSLSYESRSGDYGISYEYLEEFEGLELSGESLFDNTKSNRDPWPTNKIQTQKKKKRNHVFLEGFVETSDEDELGRTKSLTDEDLDELKGCLDLGFGFSYDEIPELCNTLPALELCYSMSQKFLDEQQQSPDNSDQTSSGSPMTVTLTPVPLLLVLLPIGRSLVLVITLMM